MVAPWGSCVEEFKKWCSVTSIWRRSRALVSKKMYFWTFLHWGNGSTCSLFRVLPPDTTRELVCSFCKKLKKSHHSWSWQMIKLEGSKMSTLCFFDKHRHPVSVSHVTLVKANIAKITTISEHHRTDSWTSLFKRLPHKSPKGQKQSARFNQVKS